MNFVQNAQELDTTKFLDIYNFIVDVYRYIQQLSVEDGADNVAPVITRHIANMTKDDQQKLQRVFEPLTWFDGPLAYAATTLLSAIENDSLIKSTRRNLSYAAVQSMNDKTPLLPNESKSKKLTRQISLKTLPNHFYQQTSDLSKAHEELATLLEFVEELKISIDPLEQNCWPAVCCLALALQNTIDNMPHYQNNKGLTLQHFADDIENYKYACHNYLADDIPPKKESSWLAKFFCCCQSTSADHSILTRLDAITQNITFTENKMITPII